MNASHEHDEVVYDVLGVGFGPSNLALAIAVEEHNRDAAADEQVNALFLEKQPSFGWHRGMLIDDATMQVSFFKDLVTLRDPTSDFSFLCYLKAKGRLVHFLNQKSLFPLRVEFHDYFEWAASRLERAVRYSAEVVSIEPVEIDGEIAYFDVISNEGDDPDELVVRRARNICVATGLQPSMPADAPRSERVWHNRDLLPKVEEFKDTPVRRAIVVGAGQSAAESVSYLHRNFPQAEVCAVFTRYGYTPADDSPYANRIFDPEAVDAYYHAPPEVKRMLWGYHRNTNYGVVDLENIEELYRLEYQERVQGNRRLFIHNASQIRSADAVSDGLRVEVEYLPTGEVRTLEADVLVYATGYRPSDVSVLLGDADRVCRRDADGELCVGRDYRVQADESVTAGIYVQGATEHAHGVTATLLSNTAIRAGEILDSIRSAVPAPVVPARDFALTGEKR